MAQEPQKPASAEPSSGAQPSETQKPDPVAQPLADDQLPPDAPAFVIRGARRGNLRIGGAPPRKQET